MPFITMGVAFKILATLPWFTGMPLAGMVVIIVHLSIMKYIIPLDGNDAIWRTPYFSGIFQASAFWVLLTWMWIIVPCKLLYTLYNNSNSNKKCLFL